MDSVGDRLEKDAKKSREEGRGGKPAKGRGGEGRRALRDGLAVKSAHYACRVAYNHF